MKTQLSALHPPDPAFHIRPAIYTDLDALMRCCWTDRTYQVGRWLLERSTRNRRTQRGTGAVALNPNSVVIGYGQLTLWPRCAEISDLIISEPYRSQGYGTALIQYLVREAVRLKASCVEIGAAKSNPGAVALYRRLGFEDQRVVMMNLGGGDREPVIYMQLYLDPNA